MKVEKCQLALRARRGLKLERRARTHGALPRTRGTEGTERKGLDTRNSKILLGEFYHEEDRKQKGEWKEEAYTKKN